MIDELTLKLRRQIEANKRKELKSINDEEDDRVGDILSINSPTVERVALRAETPENEKSNDETASAALQTAI